jgi:hypothetical protein
MPSAIFHVDGHDQLTALPETAFASEKLLQELLAKFPSILSSEANAASAPEWLLVTRELSVPDDADGSGRWSLDHLFLDHLGIPTLVEVKRSTDLRIRREVVGQMLDYAANAVAYVPVERMQDALRNRCTKEGIDASTVLQPVLMAAGRSEEDFWQLVKTNLQAGRVRLVFVADVIPPSLRRIVEFLNEQMDPADVLAIEVRQYVGPSGRTLVPTLVGRTAEASRRKAAGSALTGPTWTWDTLSAALRDAGAEEGEQTAARAILDWANTHKARVWWGAGTTIGSFIPVVDRGADSYQLISVRTNRTVEMQFQWLLSKAVFADGARLEELRLRLNSIAGISIGADRLSGRPSIPLSVLAIEASRSAFLAAWDALIAELPSAGS